MKISFRKRILKKIYKKDKILRLLQLLLGLTISSISFNLFCLPNNLVSGGVSGLSIIIESLFGITPSLFMLIVNFFLLILSYLLLGKEKTIHVVVGALLFPLFVEITSNLTKYISVEENKVLLSALFAGVMSGTASGLVFKSGYSSGGTDIVNQILSKYLKISMGNAIYFTDGIIILLSGIVFGINKIMYGIIILYIISYVMDKVIIGISSSKAFYIITTKQEKVENYIIKKLHHSVTSIETLENDNNVLMTVLPTKEYYIFKEGINRIDKEAFFLVTDAYEVKGGE